MKWTLIVMMMLCGLPLQARAAVPQQALLMYAITPGKPGAPSERVTLIRDGGQYRIVVQRAPYDQERQHEEAGVTAQEFEAVWAVAERQGILHFKPKEKKVVVADFGGRELHTEVQENADTKPIRREWAWGRPLENEAPVEALAAALAHLARAHVKSVPLYYFPQEP